MKLNVTEELLIFFGDPKVIHSRQFPKAHRLIIVSAAIIDLLASRNIGFKRIGDKHLVPAANADEVDWPRVKENVILSKNIW